MMDEIWMDISGYENKYRISSFGRVMSLDRLTTNNQTAKGVMLSMVNKNGYSAINLCKDKTSIRVYVHRIVAQHFLPADESRLFVNHKNGVRTDNRVENLEWVNRRENQTHGFKNKKRSRYPGVCFNIGSKKWQAVLHFNHSKIHLGLHLNEEDAGKAYQDAMSRYGLVNKYAEI